MLKCLLSLVKVIVFFSDACYSVYYDYNDYAFLVT